MIRDTQHYFYTTLKHKILNNFKHLVNGEMIGIPLDKLNYYSHMMQQTLHYALIEYNNAAKIIGCNKLPDDYSDKITIKEDEDKNCNVTRVRLYPPNFGEKL